MSSARQRLPALALLVLGGLAATPAAHALDASGATSDRLRVCGPTPVRITWTVRLGSTRVLVVESPVGRFAGAGDRTFSGLLRREGAVGTVVFSEVVTVPGDLTAAALEGGAPVTLRRRFDVLRSVGPPESVEATPLRLAVVPPRLTVAVTPTQTTINACEESVFELRWSIVARDAGPLDVESERGALLLAGSEELAAPGGRLAGRVVDRLALPETLRLTPELTGAALVHDALEYRRRFVLSCGGFERSLEAPVALVVTDPEIAITVAPERATVTVGRTVPVPLRWSALGIAPCIELFSSEVRVETAGARVLARLESELLLRGSAVAAETLPVSAAVSQAALDLGVADLRIVREFVLVAPVTSLGAASAVTAGSVTARPVTARRVVARPAVDLLLTGSISQELSVLRLALRFEDGEVFRQVPRGSSLRALAEITTAGSGPLRATWELADPTSTSGPPVFRPLQLVARHLSAGGPTVIESPDLPTERQGLHLLRLRLSAPAVDFAVPVLRYQVVPGWQLPAGPQPPTSLPLPPRDPALVEDDDPVAEREVLALSAGLDEARALEALGLELKLRYRLRWRWPREDGEPLVLSVLRVPRGTTVREAVRQIRRRYPDLWVDANDLYAPQSGGFESDVMALTEAMEALEWDKQKQCQQGVRIGTIDGDDCHAHRLAGLLEQLVPKAVVPQPATDGGLRCDDASEGGDTGKDGDAGRSGAPAAALGSLIDALEIALALDRMSGTALVQFGITGRSNLVLRFIFKYAVEDHMVFVAPYNNEPESLHSYPASSARVIGVVAYDPEAKDEKAEDRDGRFFAAPKLKVENEPCENSCAVPVVTAALWVLGAGEEGSQWGSFSRCLEKGLPKEQEKYCLTPEDDNKSLSNVLKPVSKKRNVKWIKAPLCKEP